MKPVTAADILQSLVDELEAKQAFINEAIQQLVKERDDNDQQMTEFKNAQDKVK